MDLNLTEGMVMGCSALTIRETKAGKVLGAITKGSIVKIIDENHLTWSLVKVDTNIVVTSLIPKVGGKIPEFVEVYVLKKHIKYLRPIDSK